MAIAATSNLMQLGASVLASVGPKAVGSSFRVKDDWHAPQEIRKLTMVREGATLAQIAVYSTVIDRGINGIKTALEKFAGNNPQHGLVKVLDRLTGGLKKAEAGQSGKNPLVAVGLAVVVSCISNFTAESLSRKLAPRDIWDKGTFKGIASQKAQGQDDDDRDDDDDKVKKQPLPMPPTFQAAQAWPGASHHQSAASAHPFAYALTPVVAH